LIPQERAKKAHFPQNLIILSSPILKNFFKQLSKSETVKARRVFKRTYAKVAKENRHSMKALSRSYPHIGVRGG
jgi:hypothetical protein